MYMDRKLMKETLGIKVIDTRVCEVLQETRMIAGMSDSMQMLRPRMTMSVVKFERDSIKCDGMSVDDYLIKNVFKQLPMNGRM
jgi:hypothetical protein